MRSAQTRLTATAPLKRTVLKTNLKLVEHLYNFKTDGPSYYLGSDGGCRRPPTLFTNIGVPLKILLGLPSCAPQLLTPSVKETLARTEDDCYSFLQDRYKSEICVCLAIKRPSVHSDCLNFTKEVNRLRKCTLKLLKGRIVLSLFSGIRYIEQELDQNHMKLIMKLTICKSIIFLRS